MLHLLLLEATAVVGLKDSILLQGLHACVKERLVYSNARRPSAASCCLMHSCSVAAEGLRPSYLLCGRI